MNTPEEVTALRLSLKGADDELSTLIIRAQTSLRAYMDLDKTIEQNRAFVRAALNTLDAKGEQLPYETPAMTRSGTGSLHALARFLEDHGDEFLSWRDGSIVVESHYDKQFKALGGDTNRLISFFEDYGNATEAGRKYIEAMNVEAAPSGPPQFEPADIKEADLTRVYRDYKEKP